MPDHPDRIECSGCRDDSGGATLYCFRLRATFILRRPAQRTQEGSHAHPAKLLFSRPAGCSGL